MKSFRLNWVYKRLKGTEKGFTLLELIVVLAIVLILSSVAMFLYQKSLAYAKGTVCQTNLKALQKAIIIYAEENDVLPATLGDLKLKHLEKGFAEVIKDHGWLIKASTYLVKFDESDHAHAQFLSYDNLKDYGAGERIFRCPADKDGGSSYGINGDVAGKRWVDVREFVIVVADSEQRVFYSLEELSKRHKNAAFAANKRGTMLKIEEERIVEVRETEPNTSSDDKTTDKSRDDARYGSRGNPRYKPKDLFPRDLDGSVKYFDALVEDNKNTPIADKAEDVRNKLLTALDELSKSRPDSAAAQGKIKGAEGDLKAMIEDGLIDPVKGSDLRKLFRDISKKLK